MARPAANPYAAGQTVVSTLNTRDTAVLDYTDEASTADRARANHTGTQLASTISDFSTAVRTNRAITVVLKTASYTPVSGDEFKRFEFAGATTPSFTLPADTTTNFAVGSWFELVTDSGDPVTIAAAAGVTLVGFPLKVAHAQVVRVFKRDVNYWIVDASLPTDHPGTGTVATALADGTVSWETPSVTSNPQTGAYTYVLSDAGKSVDVTSAVPVALTVPPSSSVAWPAGAVTGASQQGAGTVSVVAGAGVTVHPPAGYSLAIADQYGEVSLRYLGSDVWVAAGNLAPAA